MKPSTLVLMVALAVIAAGCAAAGPSNEESTGTAQAQAAGQATLDARTTSVAGTQVIATQQEATRAHKTQQAENAKATSAAATQNVIAAGTSEAGPMAEVVKKLAAEGVITSSEGSYAVLDDFDASWPQLGWYQYGYAGAAPTDFVLRANASWDSASDKADWWNSGCGIVFRETNVDNHYLAFLGLDGHAHITRFKNGVFAELGDHFAQEVDIPKGSASIMLVAEGNQFTFYVDEQMVLQRQDSAHPEGDLAYTVLSGTNKGFGTRCQLSNVHVWTLE